MPVILIIAFGVLVFAMPIIDGVRYGWQIVRAELAGALLGGGPLFVLGVYQCTRHVPAPAHPQGEDLTGLAEAMSGFFLIVVAVIASAIGTILARFIAMRSPAFRARQKRCHHCGSRRIAPLTDIRCPDCGEPLAARS